MKRKRATLSHILFTCLIFSASSSKAAGQACESLFSQKSPELELTGSHHPYRSQLGGDYFKDLLLRLPSNPELRKQAEQALIAAGAERDVVQLAFQTAAETGTNSISLKSVSPTFARKMTGVVPQDNVRWIRSCESGNCWNATENWFDATTGISFTKIEVMDAKLKTEFRPLEEFEKPALGDVVVLRTHGRLIHTAIYINSEFVWHKISAHDIAGFEFWSHADMMRAFARSEKEIDVTYVRKLSRP